MSQQLKPRAFTDEELVKFNETLNRLSQREDIDNAVQPFASLEQNVLFWVWQQATRDVSQNDFRQ